MYHQSYLYLYHYIHVKFAGEQVNKKVITDYSKQLELRYRLIPQVSLLHYGCELPGSQIALLVGPWLL